MSFYSAESAQVEFERTLQVAIREAEDRTRAEVNQALGLIRAQLAGTPLPTYLPACLTLTILHCDVSYD